MGNDIKACRTCATIVALFLVAWTPYLIIALIGVFGDRTLVTPMVNAIPSLFAKSSCVYNPIVYALKNQKFRRAILSLMGRIRHCLRKSPTVLIPGELQTFSLINTLQ